RADDQQMKRRIKLVASEAGGENHDGSWVGGPTHDRSSRGRWGSVIARTADIHQIDAAPDVTAESHLVDAGLQALRRNGVQATLQAPIPAYHRKELARAVAVRACLTGNRRLAIDL